MTVEDKNQSARAASINSLLEDDNSDPPDSGNAGKPPGSTGGTPMNRVLSPNSSSKNWSALYRYQAEVELSFLNAAQKITLNSPQEFTACLEKYEQMWTELFDANLDIQRTQEAWEIRSKAILAETEKLIESKKSGVKNNAVAAPILKASPTTQTPRRKGRSM